MPSKKPGRPSKESYWVATLLKREQSDKTQKEFCEAMNLNLATFKKNLARIRGKISRPVNATIRTAPGENGTRNCIISLPSGSTVVLRESDALTVRDTLIGYYGEALHENRNEMLRAVDLAQQRLRDYEMRQYGG